MTASRFAVCLIGAALLCPPGLHAQDAAPPAVARSSGSSSLDAHKVLVLWLSQPAGDPEAERYAKLLAAAAGRALGEATLTVTIAVAPGVPDPLSIRAWAEAAATRWIVTAGCGFEDERLVWTATAWDGEDGGIVGADFYSSYPGPAVVPLLDDSARRLAAAMSLKHRTVDRAGPIEWRLHFESEDEGALVCAGRARLGDDGRPILENGAVELGRIEKGLLTAPYLPLRKGQQVSISVLKRGYWPSYETITIGEDGTWKLRPLMVRARFAWGLECGLGPMLGAEGFLRWYPAADRVFVEGSEALWFTENFQTASAPELHDQVGLSAGLYPFIPPRSPFRLSVKAGASLLFTYVETFVNNQPFALDAAIEPCSLGLEWNFPRWALTLELGSLYSLGLENGRLPAGWLALSSVQAPLIRLGVMLK
jgi:hypothetical protein